MILEEKEISSTSIDVERSTEKIKTFFHEISYCHSVL
jgi:hypothetical protein